MERTLAIVKPDAIRDSHNIITELRSSGLREIAAKRVRLTTVVAEAFYEEHHGKPFFDGLIRHMTSGPCLPLVLEGMAAITHFRRILGATDPRTADPGSLRARWGSSLPQNALHGSDSVEAARWEISFFFAGMELI